MSTVQPPGREVPGTLSWGAVERLAPWPPDAHRLIEGLRVELERLRRERDQLQTALESRVVIEQAKGVLAERLQITAEDAFEVLRSAARSAQRKLREVAAEVVSEPQTPPGVAAAAARRRGAR